MTRHCVLVDVWDWRGRKMAQTRAYGTAEELATTAICLTCDGHLEVWLTQSGTPRRACYVRPARMGEIGERCMRGEIAACINAWHNNNNEEH